MQYKNPFVNISKNMRRARKKLAKTSFFYYTLPGGRVFNDVIDTKVAALDAGHLRQNTDFIIC